MIPTMQSHDCQIWVRNFPHCRDAVRRALWRIGDHIDQLAFTLESERACGVLVGEPGLIAELHCEPIAVHLFDAIVYVFEVLGMKSHPWCELEMDCAKFARMT